MATDPDDDDDLYSVTVRFYIFEVTAESICGWCGYESVEEVQNIEHRRLSFFYRDPGHAFLENFEISILGHRLDIVYFTSFPKSFIFASF